MFRIAIYLLASCDTGLCECAWFCFSSVSPQATRIQKLLEEAEPIIEQALTDYRVPGIAIGIVADGQLVYAKGFGFRDLENKRSCTANTVFPIGSCSKAFTSCIAGMLVDEGVFSWDDRVIELFPEFRLFDEYATLHLTMRDVLTHRSGMPRHDFMWYNSSTMSRADVVHRLRYLEPSCGIREHYQYTNLMYFVAGYTMEYLMKKSWEELITERIVKPLGMTHTSFTIDALLQEADYALPYTEKKDTLKKMGLRDVSLLCPAAGINSNIKDLAQWIKLHLSGGMYHQNPIISQAALQEMHSPQTMISGVPESKEALIYASGLGWNIASYRGHYYVSHDGGIDGFTSVVGLFPKDGIGIVILANKNLTALPRYLSNDLIDRLLDLPQNDWLQEGLEGIKNSKKAQEENQKNENFLRKVGTQPTHDLEAFAGNYVHEGYGTLSITVENGKLKASLNGLESLLDHWHYNVFVIAEELQEMLLSREGTKFSFHCGLNGEIEKVTIPFEPRVHDIIFMKKPEESLAADAYLKQFTGTYEIYGYVVEIVVRAGTLCALIPGQPIYELAPSVKNEFTVKALAGYTVRFIFDQMQNVTEVLLIQPYGSFTAERKS